MTTGERIKRMRKAKGLSVDTMVEHTHVSRSTLFRYENGEIGKIPMNILSDIAKILGTTPAVLIGWDDGEPYTKVADIDGIMRMPKMNILPILGSIACGSPIFAQGNVDGYTEVPDNINADFVLRCKGDSMINARIFHGDIVYVKSVDTLENGDIGVIMIDDDATLKRVYRYPHKIVLQPENPLYEPLIYSESDFEQVRVIGKVVAFTSVVR